MNKPCKATVEEQRKQALKHYDEISTKSHHWSSFVVNAIKAYNPEKPSGSLHPVIENPKKAFENLAKEIVEKHYGRFFRNIDISRHDKVAILNYFGYSAEDVPR